MKGKGIAAGELQDYCVSRGLRLAVAESCTGGLLGGRLTAVPGSSRYLLGGVIAYSNRLKKEVLGVPSLLLGSLGAVSGPVAEAMAEGIVAVTGADCGISVTGIAGPEGGTEEKPVGTVWIAASISGETVSRRFRFDGDRDAVREQAVEAAIRFFLDKVQGR